MFDTSHLPLAIPSIKITHILQNKLMLLMSIATEAVKSSPYFSGNNIQPIFKLCFLFEDIKCTTV